jgi:hypothetical protein
MRDEKDGTPCYCGVRTALSQHLDYACPERQAAHVCTSVLSSLQRPARRLFARELCARERSRQARSLYAHSAAHIWLLTTPGDLSVASRILAAYMWDQARSLRSLELDTTMLRERQQRLGTLSSDARDAQGSQGIPCRGGKSHSSASNG